MDLSQELARAEEDWRSDFPPDSVKLPEPGFVRDPVLGHIRLDPVDFLVLDSPPFQRLRGIAQLSFVDRIYPGANHTRFEHSLGVATIVRKLLDSLSRRKRVKITGSDVLATRLAGYFHDIGHLPFSHLLEGLFRHSLKENYPKYGMKEGENKPHELLGYMIITSKYFRDLIQRAAKLERVSVDPNDVARLAMGTENVPSEKEFLKEMIHGPFDCDRMDYLVRDAYYCGVTHGRVDVDRIIETLIIVPRKKEGLHLGLDLSGLPTIEMMYLSRNAMYNAVYFHHTARIIEGMILRAVRYMQSSKRLKLQTLIRHTDSSLLERMKVEGPKLSRIIVERLENRKFLKPFLETRLFQIPGLTKLKPGADPRIVEKLNDKFGASLAKITKYFGNIDNTVNFEESLAEAIYPAKLRAGALLLDWQKLSLPKDPDPHDYFVVRFPGRETRSLLAISPIIKCIAYEGDFFSRSLLLAGLERKTYKDKATKLFKETFQSDFDFRL